MLTMSLNDWKNLSVEERKDWLKAQSPQSLSELLVIVSDMITSDEVSSDINMLIEPNADIIIARDNTLAILKDVQYNLTTELSSRILIERVA